MDRSDIRHVSRKWRAIDVVRVLTGGAVVTETLVEMTSSISAAKAFVDAVVGFIGPYSVVGRIGLLFAVYLLAEMVQYFIKQDIDDGRAVPSGAVAVPAESPSSEGEQRRWAKAG